jgi:hypothetical protein
MIDLIWYAARPRWEKLDLKFDACFEAVCLFSTLGLVLSVVFLT